MTAKFVYELFPEKINSEIPPDNLIEVFDCYDYRYGNIFYKGQLVCNFYKQMYTDAIRDYEVIAEMEGLGLKVKKAQVVIYHLEPLRDYEQNMTVMDFESASDYSYEDLLGAFVTDLAEIKKAVSLEEKNRYYKFIEISKI